MTQITFHLSRLGFPGIEKTVELENPDPHPGVIRRSASVWARKQEGWQGGVLTIRCDKFDTIQIKMDD